MSRKSGTYSSFLVGVKTEKKGCHAADPAASLVSDHLGRDS